MKLFSRISYFTIREIEVQSIPKYTALLNSKRLVVTSEHPDPSLWKELSRFPFTESTFMKIRLLSGCSIAVYIEVVRGRYKANPLSDTDVPPVTVISFDQAV